MPEMRRSLRSLLVPLAILVAPAPAWAQEPAPAWRTELEFGFNGASGNSSFSVLRAGVKTTHLRTDVAEIEVALLARYGKSEGRVMADDARATLKVDLRPQAVWSPFAFAEAARDEIRKIDLQVAAGAGAKYSFLSSDRGDASFSGALLVDHQDFRVDAGGVGPESETKARWSARLMGERRIGDGATLKHTTFFQPAWNRLRDHLLTVTNSVSTTILGDLSLAVEHEYLHDEIPPPGIEPDDQRFSVVLKMAF